jgi:beta-lactamase class A
MNGPTSRPRRKQGRPSVTMTAAVVGAVIQVVGGALGALMVGLVLSLLQGGVSFPIVLGTAAFILLLMVCGLLYLGYIPARVAALMASTSGLMLAGAGALAGLPALPPGAATPATGTSSATGVVTSAPAVACPVAPAAPTTPLVAPISGQASVDENLQHSIGGIFATLPAGVTAVFQNLAGPGGLERRERVVHPSPTPVEPAPDARDFPAASMVKLPLMIAAFKRAEAEPRFPDELRQVPPNLVDRGNPGTGILASHAGCSLTLRQLVELTVAHSDNAGGNLLIDLLGDRDELNVIIRRDLGFRHTEFRRRFMRPVAQEGGLENLTSPADVVEMLQRIYRGRMISPAASAEMLRILALRQALSHPYLHYAGRELRNLAPRPSVAEVTGTLNRVRHSAAIIERDGYAYVLAIFTRDQADETAAEHLIARTSREVFQVVTRSP